MCTLHRSHFALHGGSTNFEVFLTKVISNRELSSLLSTTLVTMVATTKHQSPTVHDETMHNYTNLYYTVILLKVNQFYSFLFDRHNAFIPALIFAPKAMVYNKGSSFDVK